MGAFDINGSIIKGTSGLSSTEVNTLFTTAVNISGTGWWDFGVLRLVDVMEAWKSQQTSEAQIKSTTLISTTKMISMEMAQMIKMNMAVKVVNQRTAAIVNSTGSRKGKTRAGNAADLVPATVIDAIFKLNLF